MKSILFFFVVGVGHCNLQCLVISVFEKYCLLRRKQNTILIQFWLLVQNKLNFIMPYFWLNAAGYSNLLLTSSGTICLAKVLAVILLT
jgi:hypothetical protein